MAAAAMLNCRPAAASAACVVRRGTVRTFTPAWTPSRASAAGARRAGAAPAAFASLAKKPHQAGKIAARGGEHRLSSPRRATVLRAVSEDAPPVAGEESSDEGEEDDEDEEIDDSLELAVAMAKVADFQKAEDILVLDVAECCDWTRYMVLVTARSKPMMDAVIAKMRDCAREEHGRTFSANPESKSRSWSVLDLGDVVAHIFTAQEREYYDLESLYADAVEVVLPFIENPSDRW